MEIKIEFENDDILIVGKPAGIPVYSTKKTISEDSVLTWFLQNHPASKTVGDADRPGIVHRLDKQTSGLLALAKTPAGYEFLKDQFLTRKISKEYLALVFGKIEKHGVIDKPLVKIGHLGSSRVRVGAEGRKSVTEYWPLGFYTLKPSPLKGEGGPGTPGGERAVDFFTLVRVKLHTGRTHQIRVHFSSEGHPVMGDDLYGKPDSQKLAEILPRQFLHAAKLEFQLPDKTWIEVQSELPDDLKKVLLSLKIVN